MERLALYCYPHDERKTVLTFVMRLCWFRMHLQREQKAAGRITRLYIWMRHQLMEYEMLSILYVLGTKLIWPIVENCIFGGDSA